MSVLWSYSVQCGVVVGGRGRRALSLVWRWELRDSSRETVGYDIRRNPLPSSAVRGSASLTNRGTETASKQLSDKTSIG